MITTTPAISDSFGSAGQVLVARYLGLAKDSQKTSGLGGVWHGKAQQFRETARSIAKRVLTLSLVVGIVLGTFSRVVMPLLLPVICRSSEVVGLVSKVRDKGRGVSRECFYLGEGMGDTLGVG